LDRLAVPIAAQQRVRQLYAAYMLSRRDFVNFTTGVLFGMEVDPDIWELHTDTMTFTPQEKESIVDSALVIEVNSNGVAG
jgi:hypothetical protein